MATLTNNRREFFALVTIAAFLTIAALASLFIYLSRNNAQEVLDSADASASATQTTTYPKKTIALVKGYDTLPPSTRSVTLGAISSTCSEASKVRSAEVRGIDSKRYIDLQVTCLDDKRSGRLLLAYNSNQWVRAYSGTDTVLCSIASQYKLPATIVPECLDKDKKIVPNTQM